MNSTLSGVHGKAGVGRSLTTRDCNGMTAFALIWGVLSGVIWFHMDITRCLCWDRCEEIGITDRKRRVFVWMFVFCLFQSPVRHLISACGIRWFKIFIGYDEWPSRENSCSHEVVLCFFNCCFSGVGFKKKCGDMSLTHCLTWVYEQPVFYFLQVHNFQRTKQFCSVFLMGWQGQKNNLVFSTKHNGIYSAMWNIVVLY